MRNIFDGLAVHGGSFIGNVLNGNGTNLTVDPGGVNMGQNLCATAACPGAQY